MKKMKSEELKVYGSEMVNYFALSMTMMMPLTTKRNLSMNIDALVDAFEVHTFLWIEEERIM